MIQIVELILLESKYKLITCEGEQCDGLLFSCNNLFDRINKRRVANTLLMKYIDGFIEGLMGREAGWLTEIASLTDTEMQGEYYDRESLEKLVEASQWLRGSYFLYTLRQSLAEETQGKLVRDYERFRLQFMASLLVLIALSGTRVKERGTGGSDGLLDLNYSNVYDNLCHLSREGLEESSIIKV